MLREEPLQDGKSEIGNITESARQNQRTFYPRVNPGGKKDQRRDQHTRQRPNRQYKGDLPECPVNWQFVHDLEIKRRKKDVNHQLAGHTPSESYIKLWQPPVYETPD